MTFTRDLDLDVHDSSMILLYYVLIDNSANRLCRAVAPPKTLLNHLERDFRRKRTAANTSLSELRQVKGRDGVYRLSTSDQVFELCAEILQRSTHVALIDAFAMPLAELAPELVHADQPPQCDTLLFAGEIFDDGDPRQ